MKKLLITVFIALLLLTGCSKNNIEGDIYNEAEGTEISLRINGEKRNTPVDNLTRITIKEDIANGDTFSYLRDGKTYKGTVVSAYDEDNKAQVEWDSQVTIYESAKTSTAYLYKYVTANSTYFSILLISDAGSVIEMRTYKQKEQ